ncbi:unnamed protein product [Acanthoscelides obtectus]|uniref:Uncharacterized protein n=1 Tax=Acanthoscelides obtectus TaxID=200917 RepID=A0A9P0P3E3_ACAOB|nr:unnamed protein product [Acanthoscelides obtectus]CAK1633819.1 hypothetical protein AOBTE_LOCUS8408 [Acanthoscelides obtectus]
MANNHRFPIDAAGMQGGPKLQRDELERIERRGGKCASF